MDTDQNPCRCDMTIIRVIIELIAFIALLAILPLGLLELFSNYAWICFTDNRYCEPEGVSKTQLQNNRNFIFLHVLQFLDFTKGW